MADNSETSPTFARTPFANGASIGVGSLPHTDSAAASDAIDAAAHSAVLARHEAMQAAAKVHRAREALRKIQAGSAEWLSRMSQLQEAEQQAAVATRKAKDAKVVVSRVAKRVVMAQQSGAGNRI